MVMNSYQDYTHLSISQPRLFPTYSVHHLKAINLKAGDMTVSTAKGAMPLPLIKGIVTDSNNIFLWHESEDINKKSLFPKFQLIPSFNF